MCVYNNQLVITQGGTIKVSQSFTLMSYNIKYGLCEKTVV